jgi:hypothetical protein
MMGGRTSKNINTGHLATTSKDKRGKKMPDIQGPDGLSRPQSLAYFPPEKRWERLEGIVVRQRSSADDPPLVSIVGRDQKGTEIIGFWTDLPNAMYLLNLLENVRRQTAAKIPTRPPDNCKAYDGT